MTGFGPALMVRNVHSVWLKSYKNLQREKQPNLPSWRTRWRLRKRRRRRRRPWRRQRWEVQVLLAHRSSFCSSCLCYEVMLSMLSMVLSFLPSFPSHVSPQHPYISLYANHVILYKHRMCIPTISLRHLILSLIIYFLCFPSSIHPPVFSSSSSVSFIYVCVYLASFHVICAWLWWARLRNDFRWSFSSFFSIEAVHIPGFPFFTCGKIAFRFALMSIFIAYHFISVHTVLSYLCAYIYLLFFFSCSHTFCSLHRLSLRMFKLESVFEAEDVGAQRLINPCILFFPSCLFFRYHF